MRVLFVLSLILGLALDVATMLVGIERARRQLRASLFNKPTVGAFFTGLGITGYLFARFSSLGWVPVLVIATAVGLAAAGGMFGLIAGWAVPAAVRHVEDERYILQGHIGRVSHTIQAASTGEITYEHDGKRHVVPARSLDGEPIETGSDIAIERIEDGVAHVELWSRIEKQLELPS
ncbi:MAG: hypothetical protein ABR543_13265 [Gemmatimonadaceae bacterium]